MFRKYIIKLDNEQEKKRFILSAIIAIGFFTLYRFLGERFGEVMLFVTLIMMVLFIGMIGIFAEITVIKSLFFVAAELSLLIYLAQAYCDSGHRLPDGDNALKSLVVVGIMYITFTFFRNLYKNLRDYYQRIEKEPRSREKIINVSLFLFFVCVFVWQIYLVVNPIFLGLCVPIF